MALTRWQAHGVNAVPRPDGSRDMIFLWGDSHVEALQVPDSAKMHAQLNRLLASDAGLADTRVLAVGRSGSMVADYIVWMRKYEELLPRVKGHLVLITSVDELLPDRPDALNAKLVSTREGFSIVPEVPRRASPLGQFAMDVTSLGRLHFLGLLWGEVRQAVDVRRLRFFPSLAEQCRAHEVTVPRSVQPPPGCGELLRRALEFSVHGLATQSAQPIALVYAPAVCWLDNGRYRWAESDPRASLLREVCAQESVGWVDVSDELAAFTRSTKQFPRGFHNGRPGEGHLNRNGHRIIAETVHAYLSSGALCSSPK